MPNETKGPVMIYLPAPVTHRNFVATPQHSPAMAAGRVSIPPVAVHPNRISAPANNATDQSIKSLFKIFP